MHVALMDSPVGRLVIEAADAAIVRLGWRAPPAGHPPVADALLDEAKRQLAAYFAGRLTAFDLPVAPAGSAFDQAVWREMLAIPYGGTRTYGEIAKALGAMPRTVGAACGANPIAIVIPCHRVVGAGGRLVGYSGGEGVATKRALLALESPALPLFSRL